MQCWASSAWTHATPATRWIKLSTLVEYGTSGSTFVSLGLSTRRLLLPFTFPLFTIFFLLRNASLPFFSRLPFALSPHPFMSPTCIFLITPALDDFVANEDRGSNHQNPQPAVFAECWFPFGFRGNSNFPVHDGQHTLDCIQRVWKAIFASLE